MPKPLAAVPDLEAELDDLYAAPPEDFTSARNDLARRLKQAGQNAVAARVKELRKPTVALWAVNQLARANPKGVRALLDAGDRLRAAQQQALGGGESTELRAATAEERKLLRELTQQGEALLRDAGRSSAAERIARVLRAAAVDPDARELLAQGRLSEELESTGFGAFAGMEVPARSGREQRKEDTPSPAAQRRREERLKKLRERAVTLKKAATDAEREAGKAEATLEQTRRKEAKAKDAAERAEADLDAAEAEGE
jgi:hypothetical protein